MNYELPYSLLILPPSGSACVRASRVRQPVKALAHPLILGVSVHGCVLNYHQVTHLKNWPVLKHMFNVCIKLN